MFVSDRYTEDANRKQNPAFGQGEDSSGYMDVNEKSDELYEDQNNDF